MSKSETDDNRAHPIRAPSLIELPESGSELDSWALPGLDFPTFRITMIAKIMDRLTLRYFAGLSDISMPEWRVLTRLCATQVRTVGQIAEAAWADRAEVSRAVASLEKRGWIERQENPQDRRAPILFATDAGRAAFEPLMATRGRFHETILADVSPLERDLLDALLNKLALRLMVLAADSAKAASTPALEAADDDGTN